YYDLYIYIFFFQAEDGIRDDLVTGVQTCALPIFRERISSMAAVYGTIETPNSMPTPGKTTSRSSTAFRVPLSRHGSIATSSRARSEERRVGKECRSKR